MFTTFKESVFLDQCHVLCLYYMKHYSTFDLDCDEDDLKHLNENIQKEIDSFTSSFEGKPIYIK